MDVVGQAPRRPSAVRLARSGWIMISWPAAARRSSSRWQAAACAARFAAISPAPCARLPGRFARGASPATPRTLQQRLRALNPEAPIDAIVAGALTPDAVLDDWPSAERRSRIVFITRDIPQSSIEEMLTAFTGVRGDAPGWRGARGGRHTHDHEGEGPQ